MPYYPLSPNSPIDLLRLNSGLGAFGAAPGPSSMGAMMGPSSVPMASEALRGMSLERKSSSGLNEAAAEFRSSRSSSVEEPEHTMGAPDRSASTQLGSRRVWRRTRAIQHGGYDGSLIGSHGIRGAARDVARAQEQQRPERSRR